MRQAGGGGGHTHTLSAHKPPALTRPAASVTVSRPCSTVVAPPAGPAPQPAFQPGATPAEPGRPRFLCYNLVGSVSSRPVDDHHVIEVRARVCVCVCVCVCACVCVCVLDLDVWRG